MPGRTPALHRKVRALTLLSVLGLLSSGNPQAGPRELRPQEPIERADRLLLRGGWRAEGDPHLESFDRELSGNDLPSLRSCSGTGVGFCRYQYRRGDEHLEVITVPGREGDGLVHHWRRWRGGGEAPPALERP